MTVDVAPCFRVGEAELIGRDAHYFSVLLMKFGNVLRKSTCSDSCDVRYPREGRKRWSGEMAQWMKVDAVDTSDHPSYNELQLLEHIGKRIGVNRQRQQPEVWLSLRKESQ
jgi:hypothetical protein